MAIARPPEQRALGRLRAQLVRAIAGTRHLESLWAMAMAYLVAVVWIRSLADLAQLAGLLPAGAVQATEGAMQSGAGPAVPAGLAAAMASPAAAEAGLLLSVRALVSILVVWVFRIRQLHAQVHRYLEPRVFLTGAPAGRRFVQALQSAVLRTNAFSLVSLILGSAALVATALYTGPGIGRYAEGAWMAGLLRLVLPPGLLLAALLHLAVMRSSAAPRWVLPMESSGIVVIAVAALVLGAGGGPGSLMVPAVLPFAAGIIALMVSSGGRPSVRMMPVMQPLLAVYLRRHRMDYWAIVIMLVPALIVLDPGYGISALLVGIWATLSWLRFAQGIAQQTARLWGRDITGMVHRWCHAGIGSALMLHLAAHGVCLIPVLLL